MAPRRPQDRRLKRFFPILDPSWRQLRTTSHRQGAKIPQPSQITTPKPSKTYENLRFFKVFGCTTHLPKLSKMLPKSAPGPPKTGQVEAKIGPRPPKLRPRWPSCCHFGSSWARLCASWRQLCWIFSEIRRYIRRKLKKKSQEPLRTFIFCIFGASGRRFSSLSALRFLSFRLCCPSSVHASIFLSNTFCTYSLRVFPNTAGHQIVLRRLLRAACSI